MKVEELIYQFVNDFFAGDESILRFVAKRVREELPVVGYSEKDVQNILQYVAKEVKKKFY